MAEMVKDRQKGRCFVGRNLPPIYAERVDQITIKTGENMSDFLKRVIDEQYERIVECKAIDGGVKSKIDEFSSLLDVKISAMRSALDNQINVTNIGVEKLNSLFSQNVSVLRENNQILKRIFNAVVVVYRDLFRFCAIAVAIVLKGSSLSKDEFADMKMKAKSDYRSSLTELVNSIDDDSNVLINKLQE
jgi:hypothetical protein